MNLKDIILASHFTSGGGDLSNYYTKAQSDGRYALKDDLDEYVAISQGVAQAGKFLAVDSDGNVTTQSLPIYNGEVV